MKRMYILFKILLCEEGKITRSRSSGCIVTVIQPRSCFSVTMTSRFDIVDEEYIEEWKDKSENGNKKNSTEWWKNVFKKWENERNLKAAVVAVLSIRKLSNFALYIINKRWILVKLRINITLGFRSCWNCPRRCATRAISATSENTSDINPLNLIESRSDEGNFCNFWKQAWY